MKLNIWMRIFLLSNKCPLLSRLLSNRNISHITIKQTNANLKNSIYLLASALLFITACGQTNSNPDNQSTTQTTPDPKATAASKSTLDSIERTNNESVIASGDYVNKANVNLPDSTIHLSANMKLDHRFFGYAKPDVQSEKLLLFSIFTNDVENNPFGCRLGAYYDTGGIGDLKLKYMETTGNFVKAVAIDKTNALTTVFFEKKWLTFD